MRITRITAPDGSVTTVQTKSTWGCLTIFALVLVFGLPAGFPPPLNVLAYVALGVVIFLGGLGWIIQKTSRKPTLGKPRAVPLPQPPPAPAPPAPAPPAP